MEIPIVPQKLTYTVAEAAAALGVSKTVMYQLIRTEGFPVICLGNKRLIPIESFKRWTEERAAIGWQLN
ncbi:MAG: helix-turn-helix domain-containing protein [Oscillospiraceae bacterium]|nr:helix-turn-helix domain-containing protein [Oscillospiraceae bacterium]